MGRRCTSVALVATVFVLANMAVGITSPAEAAVRLCASPVLGVMKYAPTRIAAHRNAITSWRTRVARLGSAYMNWRLAIDKRLRCARMKNDKFVCVAFARPCRIVQRPPSHRRKLSPEPPRQPGTRSAHVQD